MVLFVVLLVISSLLSIVWTEIYGLVMDDLYISRFLVCVWVVFGFRVMVWSLCVGMFLVSI